MKKTILLVLFVLTAFVSNAQDKEKDQFTKDTEKLIEMSSRPALQPMIDQFAGMVPAEKKDEFLKDVEKTFPEFFGSMAKIYMEEYTHDEIKQLLAFYNSPIGKKMSSKQGVIQQKAMMAGQAWGMKVQALLGKYQ